MRHQIVTGRLRSRVALCNPVFIQLPFLRKPLSDVWVAWGLLAMTASRTAFALLKFSLPLISSSSSKEQGNSFKKLEEEAEENLVMFCTHTG